MNHRRGMLAAINVTKSHGADVVLDGVSVVVAPRARIGAIGPNGSGKTTLLRVLAGLTPPDAGRVERRPPSLTVAYLPQEADVRAGETVLSYLLRHTGLADVGAWELRRAMSHVGLDVELDRPAGELSGGQLARAKLASVVVAEHDVLLFDEPTNDLDFEGLKLLERFVVETPSALVVVSHDRAFLEHTVERIVEFEAETRNVREFASSWNEYDRLRTLARRREEDAYARHVGERDRLTGLLHERRGQARSAGRMADRRGTHALRSKVRSAERRLERLETVDKPWQPWRLQLELGPADRAGDVVARLSGAVVERNGFRLGPIDLELRYGDRLAVIGRNGSGKTTLLQALLGELDLAAGELDLGPGARFGELEQRRSRFAGSESLLQTFGDQSGLPPVDARTLLAKFALGADEVSRPSASISPGERTRAALALLAAQGVNVLVLDEPTNHLDLEAIEELETALDGYEGTVVLVTHDRRLIERFQPSATLELLA
jgi:ATPase subunit of ABC transporter with duplicated ATPase domains